MLDANSDAALAADLYRSVSEYAALGNHRTGTPEDANTIDWLAEGLRSHGAMVDASPYTFPLYRAEWEVEVNGSPIDAIPLYYQFVGSSFYQDVTTTTLDLRHHDEGALRKIEDFVERRSRSSANAILAATLSTTGDLYALNRAPGKSSGPPVLLVEGRAAPLLSSGSSKVRIGASISEGRSKVVTGWFGRSAHVPPLVITTPLSGWFSCAGERGSGIAIALQIAPRLAARRPVIVVATTGHEIGYLGMKHFLGTFAIGSPRVLHIGSCVGAAVEVPPTMPQRVTNQLVGIVSTHEECQRSIGKSLAMINVSARRPADPSDPGNWQGESECWAPYTPDMASIAGTSPLYHTAADVCASATSPEILLQSMNALLEVGQSLAGHRRAGA